MESMTLSRKRTAVTTASVLAVFAAIWLCRGTDPQNHLPVKNSDINTPSRPDSKGGISSTGPVDASSPLAATLQPAEVSPGALPEQAVVDLKRSNFEAYLRYQKRLALGAIPQTEFDSTAKKIGAEERVKARLAAALDPKTQS